MCSVLTISLPLTESMAGPPPVLAAKRAGHVQRTLGCRRRERALVTDVFKRVCASPFIPWRQPPQQLVFPRQFKQGSGLARNRLRGCREVSRNSTLWDGRLHDGKKRLSRLLGRVKRRNPVWSFERAQESGSPSRSQSKNVGCDGTSKSQMS